jgi:REP element-mobilizing transposase RayT
MAHTYSRVLLHIIFSTRNREHLITADIRNRLHAYIAGIIRKVDGEVLAINGTSDHVHLLILLPVARSISDVVRLVKTNSSKWLREEQREQKFGWQRGYAVFSVSESLEARVREYVNGQEKHHRKIGFREEYIFLQKHGVVYDDPYVWD